jgi:hypothetical protein
MFCISFGVGMKSRLYSHCNTSYPLFCVFGLRWTGYRGQVHNGLYNTFLFDIAESALVYYVINRGNARTLRTISERLPKRLGLLASEHF